MWPAPGEALDRTLHAEVALTDLYAEALRQWAPEAMALALPDLGGEIVAGNPAIVASVLPPDPDAISHGQGSWDHITRSVILPGLSTLWALSFVEVLEAFGGVVSTVKDGVGKLDAVVRSILKRATSHTAAQIDAAAAIAASDAVAPMVGAYIEAQSTAAAAIPAMVRDKLVTSLGKLDPLTVTIDIRMKVGEFLTPDSDELREVAREQGYQAAGVMNDAAVAAANSVPGEVLEKCWIATLDKKTRPTHWAADGQRVANDGKFTVGEAELDYPGDLSGPAAEVKNCRCRVGVLAKGEALPDEVDRHTERLDGRDSVVINRDGSTQQEEIERRAHDGNIRARDDPDGLGQVSASADPHEQEMSMADDIETTETETYRTFTDAVVAIIGSPTSDGRMLAADIDLSFRSFPLPLMWTKQSSMGHLEAFTVGVIESASVADGKVLASGYLLNSSESDEAADQIGHGVTGPSVDLAATEWMLTDENGKEISEEDWWDMPMDAVVLQTITAAELIGTTLVSTPAFGDTSITLNAERESRDIAVVASAAAEFRPRTYSHKLFENPQLPAPTLPTMGDDGRIYGHLACFGSCHRGIASECVTAPRSRSGYRHFHTSPAVRLDNGERLPVGRLTVGTGHAPDTLKGGPAAAHYDNTGTCFALVRVGEDEHGIWFSGVAAPGATPEQIEMGMSAPLSGDWRDFGEGLELVAALAVNTPGFAARGREDDQGRPIALVAALGVSPRKAAQHTVAIDADAIRAAVAAGVADADAAREHRAEVQGLMAEATQRFGPLPPAPTPDEEVAELLGGRA